MKTTAQKIIANPKNAIDGEVQHYRIAKAAELEAGVEIKGTRSKPYYKFADGSSMTIDPLGGYDIDWPKSMVK